MLEQFVGIRRNFHEPLRNLTAFDKCIGTPSATIDDLLVRQYGLVYGIPVDDCVLAIDEALLEQFRKQPLFPAIIFGPARRDLALPVVGIAQPFQLTAHVVNVVVGPLRGRHAVLNGRVFGWHAERIPTHGL